MKLKELQSYLQDVRPFTRPKVELEQYPTSAELASRMLYTVASMYDEFSGRTTIDLGCGTAMLSIGAALLGSPYVLGVDIDEEALEVAQSNVDELFDGELPIDFCRADITALAEQLAGGSSGGSEDEEEDEEEEQPEDAGAGAAGRAQHGQGGTCSTSGRRLCADTVIMNPPFGTKRKGVDVVFLRAAFAISRGTVYSLHKSSTRAHIQKIAERELGARSAEVLAQLRYDLPNTMKFHKQKSVDIEVDLWRFEVPHAELQEAEEDSA